MSRVDINDIDRKIREVLSDLDKFHSKELAQRLRKWPLKFLNRAIGFYSTVLKTPTGRLKRSFTPFTRRLANDVVVFGLRAGSDSDPIKYARALHDGFHGSVNVRAHARRGTRGVRAHSRQMNIRARKFFSIPMRRLIPALIQDLKTVARFN